MLDAAATPRKARVSNDTVAQAATPFTEQWFGSGQRLGYNPQTRQIDPSGSVNIWGSVDGDAQRAVTFLPGTLAQERLGGDGLTIAHLPGGHLTTNEHPQALAALITKFYDATRRT
jgi:hypothetical protein